MNIKKERAKIKAIIDQNILHYEKQIDQNILELQQGDGKIDLDRKNALLRETNNKRIYVNYLKDLFVSLLSG